MRIGSGPDATQRLLLMLAAVQREPALIRRRKQRSWEQAGTEFQGFWNGIEAARGDAMAVEENSLAEPVA
jgi:hypothetical protein